MRTTGDNSGALAARPTARWRTWLLRGSLACLLVGVSLGGWLTWRIRSALPLLAGEVQLASLQQPVKVARDEQGIPTIVGQSRADTAAALGFVHAQDRFFQMDLMRRLSAGTLSELFGKAAISNDMRFRKHRFQQMASQVYEAATAEQREILEAYTTGVNAGLKHLGSAPVEYLLLRQQPAPWRGADSILVMLSMLCDLQPMDGEPELNLGLLRERVPQQVFDFLVRAGSKWDAPLDDSQLPAVPIPAAEVWSLRDAPLPSSTSSELAHQTAPFQLWGHGFADAPFEMRVGSNNWAVSGSLTGAGGAMLASDMHLGLSVPATWYRAVLDTPTLGGPRRQLVGVTLPGAPLLIAGSNGSVAWGFTNSYGDFGDVVELRPDPGNPEAYLTPDGPVELQRFTEPINYPGGAENYAYEWTIWGPVVEIRDGRRFAYHWVGHDPGAFNLNGLDFESSTTAEQALDVANRAGMPHQNTVVADAAGNIGWTLSGRIPRRPGAPATTPVDWSDQDGGWHDYLQPSEVPRVFNPPQGRIWTANNRILGESYVTWLGGRGYDLGARAKQIHERLMEREQFTERDMLAIQLDDEARFLQRWRSLFQQVSDDEALGISAKCQDALKNSAARASTDAVGYRLVRNFRYQVLDMVFGLPGFNEATRSSGLRQVLGIEQPLDLAFEDALWQLLEERPLHWLPREYESWEQLLQQAALLTDARLTANPNGDDPTWGAHNTVHIRHPLARAIPWLDSWLSLAPQQLPGDSHMPRVQGPSSGASQRLVVIPGSEQQGLYHQPGGQSGHPNSPFYRQGFEAWATGQPTPLLPGKSQHQLLLSP